MRAGTLRERITLQKLVEGGGDAAWTTPREWVDGHRVWAGVVAASGGEKSGADGVLSSVSYTIRVRYLADVTSAWRVVWKGKVLDIVSAIDPTGRGRELEIKAVEHPNG